MCLLAIIATYFHSHSTQWYKVIDRALLKTSTHASAILRFNLSLTEVIQLGSEGKGHLEMYLHKKFYHILDVLTVSTK